MEDKEKFGDDGASDGFVPLPVDAAWLRWTRGEARLEPLKDTDPGQYYGGWRAFVKGMDGEPGPGLPIPIVSRVSGDGKTSYEVYATNVLHFLPMRSRTRFERLEETVDDNTGRKYMRTVAISKERKPGYVPHRQVFGVVFDRNSDQYSPAVLDINKWSSFIAFERAAGKWKKVDKKTPAGMALVRRYGTIGKLDKASGKWLPNFETFGEGHSTPIEAIDVENPRLVTITPELIALLEESAEWKTCPRWNQEGGVSEEDQLEQEGTPMQKFMERANELQMTNIEIEQLVKEAQGNYAKALAMISAESEISGMPPEPEPPPF